MTQVVIIDDSPRIRKRIAGLLSASPRIRIVGEAGNGREAIDAVEHARPDAILLDIRLPDVSGITLLKIFKARYPKMRVVMLTNLDGPRYRQQCRQLGADTFLNKSGEFEKIVPAISSNPAH